MQNKRIVITGIGVVSPIGIGKDAFWQSLNEGKSGIKPITLFDVSKYQVKVGGEISDFKGEDHFPARTLINLDRAARLLLTAAKLALEDSQYEISEETTGDLGVSIGTTFAALQCSSKFDQEALKDGPRLANPSLFPNTVTNAAASRISIHYKIKGLNSTISTGMCASLDAIDYGAKAIKFHNKRMIAAGGAEDLSEQLFLGFYRAGLLKELVLGEGAGVVILEDLESAKMRKAKIYAEILSTASTYSKEKSAGMASTMSLALKRSGKTRSDITYISSNDNTDAEGIQAIKQIFGERIPEIRVRSIRPVIGESLSASGILSVIASLGAMQRDEIHTALVNTSCLSGLNTSLVLTRYSE